MQTPCQGGPQGGPDSESWGHWPLLSPPPEPPLPAAKTLNRIFRHRSHNCCLNISTVSQLGFGTWLKDNRSKTANTSASKLSWKQPIVMWCNEMTLNEMNQTSNCTGNVDWALPPSHSLSVSFFRRPAGELDGNHESRDCIPATSGRILRSTPRGLLHSQVCWWRVVSKHLNGDIYLIVTLIYEQDSVRNPYQGASLKANSQSFL